MAEIKASLPTSAEHLRLLARQMGGGLRRLNQMLGGRRPAATLLCVISSRFIRADLDAEGRVSGEPERVSAGCDSIADLPKALGIALGGDKPPGRRLWLLHDGLPNHTVSVPTGQVAGLGEEPLSHALLFELEQMTGNTFANQQASQALLSQADGQNQYWLGHVPKTLVAQLQRAARQQGCQFAGLLHPGGLPRPVAPASENNWARLEIWPDALIGLHSLGKGLIDAWVIQAGTKPRRIQGEVERWRAELDGKVCWETLGEGVVLDHMPQDAAGVDLDDDATLRHWLAGWGQVLAQGLPANVPLLAPPEDAIRERWLMAGGAAAALAVCLLHWGWHSHQMGSLEKERTYLKSGEAQVMGLEVEVEKYRKQRDELTIRSGPALGGSIAQTPEVLAALRQRYAALLREVSANATDGMVVEEIKTKPNGVTVKGVSLSADEANGLASALEAGLRGLGWRVEPSRKKDLAYDAAGGPWEFEILMTDSGRVGFSASSKPVPAIGSAK